MRGCGTWDCNVLPLCCHGTRWSGLGAWCNSGELRLGSCHAAGVAGNHQAKYLWGLDNCHFASFDAVDHHSVACFHCSHWQADDPRLVTSTDTLGWPWSEWLARSLKKGLNYDALWPTMPPQARNLVMCIDDCLMKHHGKKSEQAIWFYGTSH